MTFLCVDVHRRTHQAHAEPIENVKVSVKTINNIIPNDFVLQPQVTRAEMIIDGDESRVMM